MPSKTLLHDARLYALGGGRSWQAASERRDWMISREGTDFPDDSSHVRALEAAGSRGRPRPAAGFRCLPRDPDPARR